MAPPTHLQALAGGIGFVAFCWMLWNLNREYKDDQREGDSHDHSTGKEELWFRQPRWRRNDETH